MAMAIELARKAQNPSPNPYVGAILVKNKKIVGKGFHRRAGESHAEVNAIRDTGTLARGSTLYVNLEPCVHYGKTPPCTWALINAGIKEVVIGMKDPNPLVNGRGIAELKESGVMVKEGILKKEAKRLNEIYLKYITRKMPFVILKSAMSFDGKIATISGESKWISSEESRRYVRKLRGKFDAILVGINTVLMDNPSLSKPCKVIVDSRLRIPLKAKVLKNPQRVIVATTNRAPNAKIRRLQDSGARVLIIKEKKGKVDLNILMKEMAKIEISSVLIEGGGEINASAIESGIVDKILFFIAPKIIGGRDAKTPVEGEGIKRIARAIPIRNMTVKMLGRDILIEGYIWG
ncbi:riboflavin biosynthesis protein RibD [Candidatus Desantisbacteria bacterium CG1_02_38_46]|nr:MAG: riboflavin biosynthesis protein RibD [Candidatus Desantisbacteria bacterium CG1_02_38_46]